MSLRRTDFLRGFMAMFENPTLRITNDTYDAIEARVDWGEDAEYEEIRWRIGDDMVLDTDCLEIASYVAANTASRDSLDIHKVFVPRETLYKLLAKDRGLNWSYEKFAKLYEKLLSIKIPVIDNGQESDAFSMLEYEPPTLEEKKVLQRIRRQRIVSLTLFLLFLPACILYPRFLPSTGTAFSLFYVGLMGIAFMFTSFAKCPRCRDYFNMLDPLKSADNTVFAPRPFSHCQNCELHM